MSAIYDVNRRMLRRTSKRRCFLIQLVTVLCRYGGKDGDQYRRYIETEEAASLRQQGVGGAPRGSGLPNQMQGLRASGDGCQKAAGEEYKRDFVIKTQKMLEIKCFL